MDTDSNAIGAAALIDYTSNSTKGFRRKGTIFKAGDDGKSNWAESLDRVVAGINKTLHDHLPGATPNEAAKKLEFAFFRTKEASQDLQHNAAVFLARSDKIQDDGACRAQAAHGNFATGYKD